MVLPHETCQRCFHDRSRIVPAVCEEHRLQYPKNTEVCFREGLNENQNKEDITNRIAEWLSAVVAVQDSATEDDLITYFHAQTVPAITIPAYLARINKYSKYSQGVVVAAMIYLQRVIRKHPHIIVSSRTAHRLIISAIVVSAKFNDDSHLQNSCYAQIGGICVKELNRLEVHFLDLIRFQLFITESEYSTAVCAFMNCDPQAPAPQAPAPPPVVSTPTHATAEKWVQHSGVKAMAPHMNALPAVIPSFRPVDQNMMHAAGQVA